MSVSEAEGRFKAAALPLNSSQAEEDMDKTHTKPCTLLHHLSEAADSSATAAASPAFVQRLAAEWPGLQAVLAQQHLLIVSRVTKTVLQDALNNHADTSRPDLLKVVEQLQATQHCWELMVSHCHEDAGSRIQCARQLVKSGMLQQLGDACNYCASVLDKQQQDQPSRQQQAAGGAGPSQYATQSLKPTNKTAEKDMAPSSTASNQQQGKGGREQPQLLQDIWDFTAGYSIAPSLLSLWESLVQHWPGNWLQSALATATLLPAASLAVALILASDNVAAAAAKPLQESPLQDTPSACHVHNNSDEAASSVDSSDRTSSNSVLLHASSFQHNLCALKVSCKLVAALHAPLAAMPAGCIPAWGMHSAASPQTAAAGIPLPWMLRSDSVVYSIPADQLLRSKELHLLLCHHLSILADHPDVAVDDLEAANPAEAAAYSTEQQACSSTNVWSSSSSGYAEVYVHVNELPSQQQRSVSQADVRPPESAAAAPSAELSSHPVHAAGLAGEDVQALLYEAGMQQQAGLQLLQQALQVALLAYNRRAAGYGSVLLSWRLLCNNSLLPSMFSMTAACNSSDLQPASGGGRDSRAHDSCQQCGCVEDADSALAKVAEAVMEQAAAAVQTAAESPPSSSLSNLTSKASVGTIASVSDLEDVLPHSPLLLFVLESQLALFRSVQQRVQTGERPLLLALLAASISSSAHELSVHREVWEVMQGVARHKATVDAQQVQLDASAADRVQDALQASWNVMSALLPHLLACCTAVSGPAAAAANLGSSTGAAVACVLGSEYVAAAAAPAAAAAGQVAALMLQLFQEIQARLQMLGPGSGCPWLEAKDSAAAYEQPPAGGGSKRSTVEQGECQQQVQGGLSAHTRAGRQATTALHVPQDPQEPHQGQLYLAGVSLLLEAAVRQEALKDSSSCSTVTCLGTIGKFLLPSWQLRAGMRTIMTWFLNDAKHPVRDAMPGSVMKEILHHTAAAITQQQEGTNAIFAQLQFEVDGVVQEQVQQQQQQVQQQQQQQHSGQCLGLPPLPASSEAMFNLCCSFLKCLDIAETTTATTAAAQTAAAGKEEQGPTAKEAAAGGLEGPHTNPHFGCLLQQLTAQIGAGLAAGRGSCPDAAPASSRGCAASSSSSAAVGMAALADRLKWQLLSARACYTGGAWLQQQASRLQDGSSQQQQAGQAWLCESEVLSSCCCLAAWACRAVQQLTDLQAAVGAAAAATTAPAPATDTATGAGTLPECVSVALQLLPLGQLVKISEDALPAVQQAADAADKCMTKRLQSWYCEKRRLAAQIDEVSSIIHGWSGLVPECSTAQDTSTNLQGSSRLKLLQKGGTAVLPQVLQVCGQLRNILAQAQGMLQKPLPGELHREVRCYVEEVQAMLNCLQVVQATAENAAEVRQARGCTGGSSAVGSRGADVGRGAAVRERLKQRVKAIQAGSSSAAVSAGTATTAGPSSTSSQTASGSTAAATGATSADIELGKHDEQHCDQLRRCGELLQALGSRVWSLLPQRYVCNNLACCNLAGASERLLVAGKGCVCGGCRVARYCSKECQVQHRPQHKAVCKRLAAATAARLLAAGTGAD